jgi:Xaa-Pro dipeptidase
MRERVKRIFEKLGDGADALVLMNSVEPHLDQSFFYVFDVASGLFEGSAAVAHRDGKVTVISSPLEEESAHQAARRDRDVQVVVAQGKDGTATELGKLVSPGTPVALNYHELTYENFLDLQKLLPGSAFVDASQAIRSTRMVKDEREIERLERAGAIASRVAGEIPSMLKGGMTELELAALIEYRMGQAGAAGRSFSTIVAFDEKGAEPHYQPQNRPLKSGASLVCDFGALFERYVSDITRSFRFGPTDPELRRVHETVERAQRAALESVRAGAPARDVHLAAQKVIDESPWKGRFTHGVGHSIGLAVHDGFGMSGKSEDHLEAGMAITVEPGIYLPGKGGVRIEDDVLVTDRGYRFLTTAPRAYIEVQS